MPSLDLGISGALAERSLLDPGTAGALAESALDLAEVERERNAEVDLDEVDLAEVDRDAEVEPVEVELDEVILEATTAVFLSGSFCKLLQPSLTRSLTSVLKN